METATQKKSEQALVSPATIARLEAEFADPEVHDELNPMFIFQQTADELLLAIVAGVIDPVAAARKELANRGLDASGRWIGFDRSRELWEVK